MDILDIVDDLNQEMLSVMAMAAVASDADLDNCSHEMLQGYISTLLNHSHAAYNLLKQFQENLPQSLLSKAS